MKKVVIIVQCLINVKSFSEMFEVEFLIKKIFNESYVDYLFDEWNIDVFMLSVNCIISLVVGVFKVWVRGLI